MDIWKLEAGRPPVAMAADEALPATGYAWLDLAYGEVEHLQPQVERLTGVRIFDDHVSDAANIAHPSFFDNTDQYELVIFRGLAPDPGAEKIVTRPMTLFNFDRLLVTVRAPDSRSVTHVKNRFLATPAKCPGSPDELMHRLLSSMVDHYLELRQPLTQRLDRWQKLLLDPRKPFRDWAKLLESRTEIRKLQHLCEEQRDAIQEWRDYRVADISATLQVRMADLIEHIERVLHHVRTIEGQAESAVQIYFASTTFRTTEIMRLLTIITATFMPLTLITGIFGMNFEFIPGLHSPGGFWISLLGMLGVVAAMLAYFRFRRWL
jgi:magnesium/cobalt transport protein CorA